jgi:glutathione peroxidase
VPPRLGGMSLLDQPLTRLDGTRTTLGELTAGSAALVVNVASRCGHTPQYAGLEALHERYADRGFTVIGFPCNQFAGQEPGTAGDIAEFCSTTYGVTFPLTEKVEVNGEGRHPVYAELTRTTRPDGQAGDVAWNFEKFVLAPDGTPVARFAPGVQPDDPAVVEAVESVLPR